MFVGSDCNNNMLRDETGVKRGDTVGLCAPLANVVALAAWTLQWTIFPPERTDVGLALFSVEELVEMGKHRHG
jgi:hypothetical protein